jgi:hypothetical protein
VTNKPTGKRIERVARLRWVPLNKMRINPLAQRELKPARVDKLASEMDIEQLGYPTVSLRSDWYYVIDGQHRIEAYKKWLGDGNWEDQQIQCSTYDGLTEEEEAEIFLKQNDTLSVAAFEKFRIAVKSGRPEETDIDRIVRAAGLRISRAQGGSISAVSTLRKVYRRGPAVLSKTLRIVFPAFGDAGLEAPIIEGIGLVCHRYNGEVDEVTAVIKLTKIHRGAIGLRDAAENIRLKTGNPRAHCYAAAAIDVLNRGKGGKKLTPWWRTDDN